MELGARVSTGARLEGERHAGCSSCEGTQPRAHGKSNAIGSASQPAGFSSPPTTAHITYGFLLCRLTRRFACLANYAGPRDGYRVGLPGAANCAIVVDTTPRFRGTVRRTHAVWAADEPHRTNGLAFLTLPPMAVVWLASEAPA